MTETPEQYRARIAKRKTVELTVKVSAPAWLTKAQIRREVRTLINEQTNWLSDGGWQYNYAPISIKARRVS